MFMFHINVSIFVVLHYVFPGVAETKDDLVNLQSELNLIINSRKSFVYFLLTSKQKCIPFFPLFCSVYYYLVKWNYFINCAHFIIIIIQLPLRESVIVKLIIHQTQLNIYAIISSYYLFADLNHCFIIYSIKKKNGI